MINVINSTVHLFALHWQLFNNICLLKLSTLFLNFFVLLGLRSHSRTLLGVHSDLQFGRSCSPSMAQIFILQQFCGHLRLLGCHAAFEFCCGNRDRTAPKIHASAIWAEIEHPLSSHIGLMIHNWALLNLSRPVVLSRTSLYFLCNKIM